ncbi:MAG: glycoside hydrolase family 3 C-terminal domain-containing protein, partial [Bifidobacteriaceae bacterium]|nr:glycoside hydrolase family 3 C-terminal domain-containing protein [Bifidobacteriaceae bacterium]
MRTHAKAALCVLTALALAATMGGPGAFANRATDVPTATDQAHAALARQAGVEGMVLLENHGSSLPLPASGPVALFGVGAHKTVKGGTGSGDVNNRYTISVRQGFEAAGYTVTTSAAYWDAMSTGADGASGGGGMWGGIDYSALEIALTEASVQPTRATDHAVYVLARNSGEGSDRSSGAGDYLLSATERANLELIGRTYANVVVVLNVGGIVDTTFYKSINASTAGFGGGRALDSMILMSQAGQESGHALVDVLSGAVSPSGKLTDTWASAYWLYPASATFARGDGDSLQEDYTEGIYVGYRYFDSFHRSGKPNDPDGSVNYPFGYGASYTDFSVEVDSVTATAETVTVTSTVTNTGTTYPGQEVVQVYFSAPQTGLDKPYQELAGFGKTGTLAPGESQTLTITFPTTEMSSYDQARAAYVLEGGDYVIRVGNSSRATSVGGILQVPTTLVTEQLSTQETDQSLPNEMTSDPANFYSYPGEAAQIAAAPKVQVDFTGFTAPNNASPYVQSVAVDPSSAYHEVDGNLMSTIEALIDPAQTDWEGSGLPYQP